MGRPVSGFDVGGHRDPALQGVRKFFALPSRSSQDNSAEGEGFRGALNESQSAASR
jgi:hypothetical protein